MNEKLELLKKGDLTYFEEFYNSTKKAVFFAINLIVRDETTTEDLMQEAYMDFLENVKRLPKNANIEGFLVTSAKNKAINYYNRRKRENDYCDSLVTTSYSYDKLFDTGLMDIITEVLDETEKDVFLLHVLGEYTFQEISKIRGIPLGTLTWMFQESRKKLEAKLKGGRKDGK